MLIGSTAYQIADFGIVYILVQPVHRDGILLVEEIGRHGEVKVIPAAAIAAQGLIRLGHWLKTNGDAALKKRAARYRQAGLTVAATLFEEPYLSTRSRHQGLLLHSVYHRPNGWDHVPKGQKVPCDESSMWGDYHLRELALLILREAEGKPYLTFFGGVTP